MKKYETVFVELPLLGRVVTSLKRSVAEPSYTWEAVPIVLRRTHTLILARCYVADQFAALRLKLRGIEPDSVQANALRYAVDSIRENPLLAMK